MKFKTYIYFLLFICFIIGNNVFAQTPAFTSSKILPCLNDTVTFFDTSNHSYTSHTWTITPLSFRFVNGTNQYSQNPKVVFTSPGNYTINLSVTNSLGTHSLTKNNYIFAGGLLLPFTENWENDSTYKNWSIENPDSSFTWTNYNVSGNGSGSKAFGVNNFNYTSARNSIKRDGLISPPINLNGYSSAILNFKHAYRRYDSIRQDSLAIYISTNCGATWNRVASYMETQNASPYNYITNADLTTAFAPYTFVDWCGNIGYATCKTINLTPFLGNVIKIKFENISGNGNNLYIDDISVTGVSNMTAPVTDFNVSNTNPCSADTVSFTDFTTNNPSSWYWSFTPSTVTFVNGTNASSQNPKVLFNAQGAYSVSLTTAINTQVGNTKTINIWVAQLSTHSVIIQSSGNTNLCFGTLVTFGAYASGTNPSGGYQWYINNLKVGTNSQFFSSSTLINNDVVKCTLTSLDPCTRPGVASSNLITMKIDTGPPLPTITQRNDTLFCDLSNVSYQWFRSQISGGNLYLVGTSNFLIISSTGFYQVVVSRTGNHCSSTAYYTVTQVGINDVSGISNFKLYPNPAKDKVNIEFELNESQQITFTIYDISGKKMIDESKEFSSGSNSHQLNFEVLPKGIYFLQMKNKDGISMMQRSVVIE